VAFSSRCPFPIDVHGSKPKPITSQCLLLGLAPCFWSNSMQSADENQRWRRRLLRPCQYLSKMSSVLGFSLPTNITGQPGQRFYCLEFFFLAGAWPKILLFFAILHYKIHGRPISTWAWLEPGPKNNARLVQRDVHRRHFFGPQPKQKQLSWCSDSRCPSSSDVWLIIDYWSSDLSDMRFRVCEYCVL
jgi:hypothetical protein